MLQMVKITDRIGGTFVTLVGILDINNSKIVDDCSTGRKEDSYVRQ